MARVPLRHMSVPRRRRGHPSPISMPVAARHRSQGLLLGPPWVGPCDVYPPARLRGGSRPKDMSTRASSTHVHMDMHITCAARARVRLESHTAPSWCAAWRDCGATRVSAASGGVRTCQTRATAHGFRVDGSVQSGSHQSLSPSAVGFVLRAVRVWGGLPARASVLRGDAGFRRAPQVGWVQVSLRSGAPNLGHLGRGSGGKCGGAWSLEVMRGMAAPRSGEGCVTSTCGIGALFVCWFVRLVEKQGRPVPCSCWPCKYIGW